MGILTKTLNYKFGKTYNEFRVNRLILSAIMDAIYISLGVASIIVYCLVMSNSGAGKYILDKVIGG